MSWTPTWKSWQKGQAADKGERGYKMPTMSEYIITKRTECERCNGTGWANLDRCPKCDRKGFTETYHDFDEVLLSRLAKLRWDERWGEHTGTTKEMENPRFDGMEMRDE